MNESKVTGGESAGEQDKVERLFPFVLRAKILLVGRETLLRSKSSLQFVLVTTDIAENIRGEVLADFVHYPVVQRYTASDLERFFGFKGAKTIGFAKSGLSKSLYAELKPHRINAPLHPAQTSKPAEPGPEKTNP